MASKEKKKGSTSIAHAGVAKLDTTFELDTI